MYSARTTTLLLMAALSLPLSVQAQTTTPQTLTPQTECQKRFRLAEINAQLPHLPGMMHETCEAIDNICDTEAALKGRECTEQLAWLSKYLKVMVADRQSSK